MSSTKQAFYLICLFLAIWQSNEIFTENSLILQQYRRGHKKQNNYLKVAKMLSNLYFLLFLVKFNPYALK